MLQLLYLLYYRSINSNADCQTSELLEGSSLERKKEESNFYIWRYTKLGFMTTLSTWEAELWNVDWSSKEGLKIFKAILLLKNPRGPEQERVSSALWLCCWRITGDSLCISESGPVKDSFPSPSRLCQKQRSSYKPRQVHLLLTLLPVYPVTPSSPDLISLR